MPTNPLPDPVIDEIRAIRSRISADCDHDPEKLVRYYVELQRRPASRLIGDDKASASKDEAAA
jgi:hypothetical protein